MLAPSSYGLNNAQEDLLLATLADSHDIRIRVDVYDHNEVAIKTITPVVLSGQVQVDTTADVSRSLSIQFLDPLHRLQFDSTNPAEGALFADNFIGVKYGVKVPDLGWVDIPIFFGPLTSFSRDGSIVDVEAQGKEALALDPHFVTRHYVLRKGITLVNAIKKVMGELGEQRFALNMINGRLQRARSVTPGEQPWKVCTGGGEDAAGKKKPPIMGKQLSTAGDPANFLLFYDGRGVLTAKRRNTAKPLFVFKHTKHVITWPKYTYDVLAFRNHAEVIGGKGKNAQKKAHGEYTLPAAHPLSPASLARNGRGRFLTIFHEADGLKTDAKCRQKARLLVEATAFQGVDAAFDSLPIPMLEEGDNVLLDMGEYQMQFRLQSFTIPLTAVETMAIGYNKRANLPRGRRTF